MPRLLFLVLTTFFALEEAASATSGACTSTASELPADGRGLLQMLGEKQTSHPFSTSRSASTSPQEGQQLPVGHWHSLLQGWASRIGASSHLQTLSWGLSSMLLTILAVVSCLACCTGLYTGSMLRDGSWRRPGVFRGAEQRTLTGPPLNAPRSVSRQPRPDSTKQPKYEKTSSAAENFYLCPSLVVPPEVNSVFLLNFLEAKPGACSDKVLITDLQGSPVLAAYIDRPSPGTTPKHPVVTLMMSNMDEMAKCFLRPGKNGLLFELCNQEGRPGAVLSLDQGFHEQKWTLRVCSSAANPLYITGQISNSLSATVRDAQGDLKAEAEPVLGVPLRAKVRIYSGVDCGLVICSLFGMGELIACQ
eukprot:TRINITY_DN1750_c0_g2_i1.p1 TRINITY_DN1750_c0_g2~~TRINITY_DN1750_c0_g2_i1.p1  ORF type:complete len:362 (+),score=63.60 TRINITY_DN1750_c0_g2_i1:109-1194(+)